MRQDKPKIDKSSWDEIQVDGWFKGLIPPAWEIEDDEEVIIYDPTGFGELRLNLFVKNDQRTRKERAADIVREWTKELGCARASRHARTGRSAPRCSRPPHRPSC